MASLIPDSVLKQNKTKPDPNQTLSSALARIQSAGQTSQYSDTGKESFQDQAKRKGLGLLSTVFDVIGRPSQAVLRGIQAEQAGTNIPKAIARGFTGSEHGFRLHSDDTTNLRGALNTDNFQTGKGEINPEAEKAAENQGGRWAGALDLVGTTVLDPTTYVTLGSNVAAKVGAKVAAGQLAKTGSKELADKIIQNAGKKSLSKVLTSDELDQVRNALIKSDAAALSKKTAEKYAEDSLKALNKTEGFKLAGKTIIPTQGLVGKGLEAAGLANKVNDVGDVTQRSVQQILKDTKAGQAVDDAFNTFARSGRLFGGNVQQALRDIRTRATVAESAPAVDAARQLDNLAKKAKATTADLHTIEEASKNGTLRGLATDLRNSGQHSLADLAEAKANFDEQANKTLGNGVGVEQTQKATPIIDVEGNQIGVRPQEKFRVQGQSSLFNTPELNQPAVVFTKHGLDQLKNNPGAIGSALGLTAEKVRAVANKGILPEGMSSQQFNDAVKAAVKTNKDIVESNPLKTTIGLTRQAAAINAREQTIKDLSELKASDGSPIVSRQSMPGYEAVKTADGEVYVPHEIKKDFLAFNRILSDDKSINGFKNLLDGWNQLWRAYATVPLLGFGFHLRNMQGNIFNNMLAGVKNPKVYGDALKLQRAIQIAQRSTEGFDKGLAKQGLSERDLKIIQEAKRTGVIGDFLVQADQELSPVLYESSKFKKAWAHLNPIDRRNLLLRSGTEVGKVIEQNGRLALFLDQIAKHGDPVAAAQTVRKYLFDYSDLTPFEQNVLRRVIPFYTYMRKNTALQLAEGFKKPGVVGGLGKIQNEATIEAPDTGDKSIPKYALAQGMVPILGGGNPLLAGVSTPIHAAAQTLQPAAGVIGLIGGDKNPLHPEGGAQEAASSIVNQFGGAPVEAAKFAIEEATGKDLFTGANIKTDTGSTADRLAKALAPAYGKEESLRQGVTGGGDEARAKLLSALTGLSTLNLTDKRSEGEAYRRTSVVQDAINQLKDSGTDIPTINELRKAGLVPKATSKKPKITKVKKAKKPKALKIKKPKIIKPKKPGS